MSFNPLNWFSAPAIAADEAFVVNVIGKAKAGIAVVEADIHSAIGWLVTNAPAITADINTLIVLVLKVGGNTNPEVAAAIAAANIAVNVLNTLATAKQSGSADSAAIVAAYGAIKQATGSTALAAASVVK